MTSNVLSSAFPAFRISTVSTAPFGGKPIDKITTEEVRLKHAFGNRVPKTVNDVLTVLSVTLRSAVE